jgi:hypothetical protein
LHATILMGFDLLSERGHLLRLHLSDGRVLQLYLVVEIVERRLRAGNIGLRLRDLGFIVGRIDLNQEIAGLDTLEIVRGDNLNFAGDAAAQPRQLGPDISVVRVWMAALPTQSSQRSVASTTNPNAISTANNGSARRATELREAGGEGVSAAGADGADPG